MFLFFFHSVSSAFLIILKQTKLFYQQIVTLGIQNERRRNVHIHMNSLRCVCCSSFRISLGVESFRCRESFRQEMDLKVQSQLRFKKKTDFDSFIARIFIFQLSLIPATRCVEQISTFRSFKQCLSFWFSSQLHFAYQKNW